MICDTVSQANFRDMGEHRLMTRDECLYFVGSLERCCAVLCVLLVQSPVLIPLQAGGRGRRALC